MHSSFPAFRETVFFRNPTAFLSEGNFQPSGTFLHFAIFNITKVNEIKSRWNHNSKYLAKQIARTIIQCLNLQKNDCPATWNMFRFNPTNITKVNEIKLRWNHNSKYLAKQIARTKIQCLNLQKNDCAVNKVNEIK